MNLTTIELQNSTDSDLEHYQNILKKDFDSQQKQIELLVSKLVHNAIKVTQVKVTIVYIDPEYEYNDEGYRQNNIMVYFKNCEDYFDDDEPEGKLQTLIDDNMETLATMLKKAVSFEVSDLEAQFGPIYNTPAKKKSKIFGKIKTS